MAKVRVPVLGTVGKSIRVDPNATTGAQIGEDLQLPDGSIPTLKELAIALYIAQPPEGTLTISIDQTSSGGPAGPIFEADIIDADILARVAHDELITGDWDFRDTIRISDAGGTDWLDMTHTGTAFQFEFTNTTAVNFSGPSIEYNFDQLVRVQQGLTVLGGNSLIIADATFTASGDFSHDGTDFNSDFPNTTDWNITGISGFMLLDAAFIRIHDSDNDAWIQFAHDGTDINTTFANTTAWNISGVTLIDAGLVDAEFQNMAVDRLEFFSGVGATLVDLNHDGTDFNADFTSTTDWNITGLTGFMLLDAAFIRIHDSDNDAWIQFAHDGVDINTTFANTTAWNISGITLIDAGLVDAEFQSVAVDQLEFLSGVGATLVDFNHDGTDFNTDFTSTTDWSISGLSGSLNLSGFTALNLDGPIIALDSDLVRVKGERVTGLADDTSHSFTSINGQEQGIWLVYSITDADAFFAIVVSDAAGNIFQVSAGTSTSTGTSNPDVDGNLNVFTQAGNLRIRNRTGSTMSFNAIQFGT